MKKNTTTFLSLGLLLLSLLGVNANPQTYLQSLLQNGLAQSKQIEYNHPAPLDENHYAAKLDGLGLNVQAAPGSTQQNEPDLSSLNHCKSLVYRTLESLPAEAVKHLQNLTLSFDNNARRGLGGGSTIILRCSDVTDEELVGVLVHEMGHIEDTGVLQGTSDAGVSGFKDGSNPVYNNDPSLDFYRLSWLDSSTLRPSASPLDFVSGYAQSDPFEDFAETYNYYILHGDQFRELLKVNPILQKKYDFLKTRVFGGKEFFNGDDSQPVSYVSRDYDTTVLPYDMQKFLLI
jgi:hypothetical protein